MIISSGLISCSVTAGRGTNAAFRPLARLQSRTSTTLRARHCIDTSHPVFGLPKNVVVATMCITLAMIRSPFLFIGHNLRAIRSSLPRWEFSASIAARTDGHSKVMTKVRYRRTLRGRSLPRPARSPRCRRTRRFSLLDLRQRRGALRVHLVRDHLRAFAVVVSTV